jgi:hypothetical protein
VEECGLAGRGAQGQERVVVHRHVPEVGGRDPVHVGEGAQEEPGEVDQVDALVHELAPAGQCGIGPPLLLVAHASAVAVAAAHEQERPQGARLRESPRLEQRGVIAMVEPHAHAAASLGRRFDEPVELGRRSGRGLLHQHVLPGLEGQDRGGGQRVVGRGHDHDLDLGMGDEVGHGGGGDGAGKGAGQIGRAPDLAIGAGHEPGGAERGRSLAPDEPAAHDAHARGLAHLSPQVRPRSLGTMRRRV